ncbi:putative Cytoskeleton assembly control protein Sla1 [Taphrina deformans PYCC 5710]|uniref:Actin cytoskeleton-regulatory complex protein SLA1 n=1 Tax=Taphrina deformans (strain PYCC 5710 / ATCC 11124 / CBS 356.35 / IMI 108563 / JCM 9778 / NBRC 8474) TaxID=1097556 RepID=R4XBE0_TAPDE|nr:putative Cytoskeleton assembly control protein Sla1 [Taphrina deformans PYCC 5710]|eukprot:CCG81681.1 putative Cytoskeleton assembly control protein Sla1 [Taphrina deformans PYCC 5710]
MATILGIAKGLYDYASQQPNPTEDDRELSIEENEMLYILERGDDGWWKVKKKAEGDQEEGDEGLVPANYVEEASPLSNAVAMYDYDRQTSEEVSFVEGAHVSIYDKEDPDWFLVGAGGQFGFAPSNYLEETGAVSQSPAVVATQGLSGAIRPGSITSLPPPAPPLPATAPAITHVAAPSSVFATQPRTAQPDFSDHTALESDHEESPPPTPHRPALPTRQSSQGQPPMAPRPTQRDSQPTNDYYTTPAAIPRAASPEVPQNSASYRTWPVQEVEGKKKKKKGTLGLGNGEISWAPDKASESISTWPITSLVNYSREKKHVFIDLQHPPKAMSFDFHAGSSDAAQDIGNVLGELAGAARAPGIREVAGALNAPLPALPQNSGLARRERESGYPVRDGSDDDERYHAGAELLNGNEKYATVLYDFEAQGNDEVTVRAGARVVILDDHTSPDWWNIRAGKKQGVVPADYLEASAPKKSSKKKSEHRDERDSGSRRERSSSRPRSQELKPQATGGKSKPDSQKLRSWTDRSKSFKVDAQLLGCSDGKIHLHKSNGVKISVPISKMSEEDIEYVEHKVGRSLREDPPLADVQDIAEKARKDKEARRQESAKAAAQSKPASDFDWFDFFLACGCDPNVCQRYTSAFEKEGLSEDDISSLEPTLLRNLGLKEGDILKVGRHVDARLGRQRTNTASFEDVLQKDNESAASGLFSGPGGELKNNTRRGRPERSGPVNDTIDPDALKSATKESEDPWAVRAEDKPPAKPVRPQSTGAAPSKNLEDLSLLDSPLIPIPAQQVTAAAPAQTTQAAAGQAPTYNATPGNVAPAQQYPSQQFLQSIQQMQPQRTAAIPAVAPFMPQTSFGSAIVAHKTGGGNMNNFVPPPLYPHQTGYQQQQQQQMAMMQNMPAAPYQDPFKTGSAAPYQDPFRTGFAQQQTGFQPQQTGFVPQQTGFLPQAAQFPAPMQQTGFQQPQQTGFYSGQQQNGFSAQQTGFVPQQQLFQPQQQQVQPQYGMMQPQQPFGMQSQQTGFNPAQPFGNSNMPAFGGQLGPQQTGYQFQQAPQQPGFGMQQPQPTGFGGFGGFGGQPQQAQPQMSAGMLKMQQMMAEAQSQNNQTGFGAQTLQQPQGGFNDGFRPVQFGRPASTGPAARRGNIANATASNPFGF